MITEKSKPDCLFEGKLNPTKSYLPILSFCSKAIIAKLEIIQYTPGANEKAEEKWE